MFRAFVLASFGALVGTSLAAAQSAAYQIELDQPSYAPTEVISLTVTGQPGVPGVVLIDPVPGPVDILGLTLDVGLSDKLTFVGVPPLGSDGTFVLPCTAPCELVDIDLYAQAVSLDPVTLELFASNSVTITSPEGYGFCDPCNECEGGVVAMTLRYLGDEEVFVEVYEEGHYQHDHDQYFAGLVGPKEVFSFMGEGSDNKLAKDTAIAINGQEVVEFHTSCSKPIAPGMDLGPFGILEVESKDNGPVCPVDPNACGECKGGVVSLTLKYQGTSSALIVAQEKGSDDDVLFTGVVEPGGEFTLLPIGDDDLANEVQMFVDGQLNVKVHTSCSEPIGPGTVWGSFEVTAAVSQDNGPICPIDPNACGECKGGVVSLTLQYEGSSSAQVVAQEKGSDDDVLFSGVVEPGDEFTLLPVGDDELAKEVEIFIDGHLNVELHTSCSQPIGPGTVWGSFLVTAAVSKDNGPICPEQPDDPQDPSSVDDCEAGKPVALGLTYTGEGCSASNNGQDADKATCSGGAGFAQFVHVVVYEDEDAVYFDGLVELGDEFFALASNADEDKFKSNTYVDIFGTDGTLLEELQFHTSCSQPLAVGDAFGSVTLTTFVPQD